MIQNFTLKQSNLIRLCINFDHNYFFTTSCKILFFFPVRGPVLCVAVHPTGKLALSVSKDKTIRYCRERGGGGWWICVQVDMCTGGKVICVYFNFLKDVGFINW